MSKKQRAAQMKDRSSERGAALVMALLITFLLLVASASLLLESSLNAQNVTDATTEQQAYNAAESGIQSAINVLRGNAVPNPLLDASKPATDVANKIDYVKALKVASSNVPGDTSTSPRMSRWVAYNDTCNDRVTMGSTGCVGSSSFSYALSVADPDNIGSNVSYSTTGRVFDNDGVGFETQKTYGNINNNIVIRYYPTVVTDLNAIGGATPTNFGYFKVTITGAGATIAAFNRFEIAVRMTKPYSARRYIRGYRNQYYSGRGTEDHLRRPNI
jgi:Flp pilus assembly protein TadG